MSVLTELNRIKSAVTDIVNAIKGKGVTVPSAAKIDDLAPLVSSIFTPAEVAQATPYFEVQATDDDEDCEIHIRAKADQAAGYVKSGTKYRDTYVTLGIDGNEVTMSCGNAVITKTVDGGATVETCTITLSTDAKLVDDTAIYYSAGDGTRGCVMFEVGKDITITVMKNTIVFLTNWSHVSGSATGNCLRLEGAYGYQAYWISGDCTFIYNM